MSEQKRRVEKLENQTFGNESPAAQRYQAAKRAVIEEMTDPELAAMETALKAQQSGRQVTTADMEIVEVFRNRVGAKLAELDKRYGQPNKQAA